MSVIEFHNVSKKFHRHAGQMLLRNHLTRFFARQKEDPFFALKHVSFSVDRGESLAVIGSNGAGKSTLLGLAAGVSQPDEGVVTVNGQVAALLELGSGFHPDLTGRENVRLNAALLGLSRKQTAEAFERIVEFSGIREFIDEPLRTYSTGIPRFCSSTKSWRWATQRFRPNASRKYTNSGMRGKLCCACRIRT